MKVYRNEILPAVLSWKLGIVETITLSKTTVIKENTLLSKYQKQAVAAA